MEKDKIIQIVSCTLSEQPVIYGLSEKGNVYLLNDDDLKNEWIFIIDSPFLKK